MLAYRWVNPFADDVTEEQIILCNVGAMLENEKIGLLRNIAGKEGQMNIRWIGGSEEDPAPKR